MTPQTVFECRGYLYEPTSFRCWIYPKTGGGHGPLDLRQGLMHSCNVYFYNVGQRLGAERLCYWLRQFGYGSPPGTGLPGESGGRVPTAQWLWGRQGRSFVPADARMMAIGQGFLEATPLQVANAMATIARDGQYLSPRVVLDGGPVRVQRRLDIPPEAWQTVQAGMYDVVNTPGGTAQPYAGGAVVPICGKTGTAQASPLRIDSNGNGRIDSGDQIVKQGDMAWFAGFAPRSSPRIAFAIMAEYVETGGGQTCGPLAKELVRLCQQRGYVPGGPPASVPTEE